METHFFQKPVRSSRRGMLAPYGLALGCSVGAWLAAVWLGQFTPQGVYVLFFGAVFVSARYGGLLPGFLTMGFTALMGTYYLLPAIDASLLTTGRVVPLVLYLAVSTMTTTLLAKLRESSEEIRNRAIRQAAVARLGQKALSEHGLAELLPEAVRAVRTTLEVEYCSFFEWAEGSKVLVLRAGAGWAEGNVGKVEVRVDADDEVAFTLRSGDSVLMEDLARETRFRPSALLRAHRVVSGGSLTVRGREGDLGVLGMFSVRARRFRTDEVHFLQAVGNVLAAAIERQLAEERLNALNSGLEARVAWRTAQLEAANRELEAFSYSVSHDLRAPLRAIVGFAGMLEEGQGREMREEGRNLLSMIGNQTDRMTRLIDDLLSFSKAGRQEIAQCATDMTGLVRGVIRDLTRLEPEREGQISLSPLPNIRGDGALLQQVFTNLISNALKFTRPCELPAIEIGAACESGEVVYYVRDNGVGFDMKYAHKLFQVFQRLHSAEDFEGTGAGLAIVQRIVHRHGGRVWVESSPGEGATFYFSLPALELQPAGSE